LSSHVITSWRGEAELYQLPVLFLKAGHLCELTRPPFARPLAAACLAVQSGSGVLCRWSATFYSRTALA
jgi:hypothetical protein